MVFYVSTSPGSFHLYAKNYAFLRVLFRDPEDPNFIPLLGYAPSEPNPNPKEEPLPNNNVIVPLIRQPQLHNTSLSPLSPLSPLHYKVIINMSRIDSDPNAFVPFKHAKTAQLYSLANANAFLNALFERPNAMRAIMQCECHDNSGTDSDSDTNNLE
jgi:hypothetical protein